MRAFTIILTSAVAALLLISISGCETKTATERDFGNSVRALVQGQTVDLTAAMVPDPNPIDSGDGERLSHVIETYRMPEPPATRPEIESNPFMNQN